MGVAICTLAECHDDDFEDIPSDFLVRNRE
jgi:hypothetical protein